MIIMANTYKNYVREWLMENHPDGESPLNYQEWEEKVYFTGEPTPEEWAETKKLYDELFAMSKRIDIIRLLLFRNRVHRRLCDDDFEKKNDILFRIQSELWSDGENSFGAYTLSDYCG